MSLVGRDAREAYTHLASRKIVAAAGSFYAYEPFRALKLEDPALRVGLAPYNTARRSTGCWKLSATSSERSPAHQEAALRVNVRWVTPLGEEIASTS